MGNQPTCYCADVAKFEEVMKGKMKTSLAKWTHPRHQQYAHYAISEVLYRLGPVDEDGISHRPMKPEDLNRLTHYGAAVIYHANLINAYNNPYLKTGADKLLKTMNRAMNETRRPCSCNGYNPLIIDHGNE
uniref:Uncharacterized protein n=1 Tax=Clandestinovirus TaxID=2831644 RepID=A0A8F8PN30_9VIRU|nr:hypothetical protein KOM_12_158 [Clandestinovirus]